LHDVRIKLIVHLENTVTKGTNLQQVKAVPRDERFLLLALKQILLEKHEQSAFNRPKNAYINLSDV